MTLQISNEVHSHIEAEGYEFYWIPGSWADDELLEEMSRLYSAHYGIWGPLDPRAGEPIRLSPARIRNWLEPRDSRIAYARANGVLIGYAIAIQTKIRKRGVISWVTQFVVHEAHRQNDVGKRLLFTIWGFSDHFAWGLISANPYAVRALEKATRRRCSPARIQRDKRILRSVGGRVVQYFNKSKRVTVNSSESKVNTEFFLDHSTLGLMLRNVTADSIPWIMGSIQPGWEWLAFTFHDQQQIALTEKELSQMLIASDALTKRAYSRMVLATGNHKWAKHALEEAKFIMQWCALPPAASVLDFGCGTGRHALVLAELGCRVLGIDYVKEFISEARREATARRLDAQFEVEDCRSCNLGREFDVGICLYDVIGSYADDSENMKILVNLSKHVRLGGYVLLSVMNLELTERNAKHRFSIQTNPDKLLELKPANIMETSGDIFDPDYYLIDDQTKLVYRKEQFRLGSNLPEEILVRDRRYMREDIEAMCRKASLKVLWSKHVKSGGWEQAQPPKGDKAKEILIFCQKAA